MGVRWCCFIEDQVTAAMALSHAEIRALSCPNPAEWLLIDGPLPDDYTHACTQHVGLLLSDAEVTKVYPMSHV